MTKFRPGDRVRKRDGVGLSRTFSNGALVLTVTHTDKDENVWFKETKTHLRECELSLADEVPAVADKKVTDYVETLQLAIEQVQNPELREDASNALTALLQTWVEPAPQRDAMAELLARKLRDLEENMVRFGHEDIQYNVPRGPLSYWRNATEPKLDKKTRDFVEVYAQGRDRNKKGLKHRP